MLLLAVACADSPPRGPGTTWRSWQLDRWLGNSGKPVEVHTWIDDDKSGIRKHVWTIGQDGKHLIATPEFLDDIRPRHLRLDIMMFLPGNESERAAYSLANFHFLHTKHCRTSEKFQYYD